MITECCRVFDSELEKHVQNSIARLDKKDTVPSNGENSSFLEKKTNDFCRGINNLCHAFSITHQNTKEIINKYKDIDSRL